MDYLVYIIFKVFKFLVLLMPKFIMKYFLNGLAFLIYLFNKEHKKYAMVNLDLVYGDTKSKEEKNDIIKGSYRNLVYNIYEFIENPTLDLEGLSKKVNVENEQYLLDAIKNDRKIILVTAHYGNWEYVTSYISLKYGKPVTVVGRHTNNKYFNDDIQEARDKHSSKMLTKKNSAKGLIKALKDDNIIGLVTDQHIDPRKAVIVEFLGHKATQVDSSARLATKFDAIIIPIFVIQNDFRDYTIKFDTPIEAKECEGENQLQRITQKEADVMSKQILDKPELWFWQHRRFKEFHKELYEQ